MKTIRDIIIVLSLIQVTLSAQLVDSIWFYFEDGIGNKDSLLYGGRLVDTINPDPKYNELPFQEFDSVFSVGSPHFLHSPNFPIEDAFYSKSYIGPIFPGGVFSSWQGFYFRIKHPPLKMYYDKSFFNRANTKGAYITPDILEGLIWPEFHDDINRYECLHDQDTLYFYLGTQYMDLDAIPDYRLAYLNNGTIDTIWGLIHGDLFTWAHQSDGPCPRTVGVDDIDLSSFIKSYYVPSRGIQVVNHSPWEIDEFIFCSSQGEVLQREKINVISGSEKSIDIDHSLTTGIYYVQYLMGNKKRITHRIMVFP